MKYAVTAISVATILLSGCAAEPWYKAPAIIDISDSKVVVQKQHANRPGLLFASKNTATIDEVKRVAESGCAVYNGKKAKILSESCGIYDDVNPDICLATNYLFACTHE